MFSLNSFCIYILFFFPQTTTKKHVTNSQLTHKHTPKYTIKHTNIHTHPHMDSYTLKHTHIYINIRKHNYTHDVHQSDLFDQPIELELGAMDFAGFQMLSDPNATMIADPTIEDSFRRDLN